MAARLRVGSGASARRGRAVEGAGKDAGRRVDARTEDDAHGESVAAGRRQVIMTEREGGKGRGQV